MLASHAMYESSRCPKCETRMMQVHVEPGLTGPDLHTLECPECELAYHALAEDQMETRTERNYAVRNICLNGGKADRSA